MHGWKFRARVLSNESYSPIEFACYGFCFRLAHYILLVISFVVLFTIVSCIERTHTPYIPPPHSLANVVPVAKRDFPKAMMSVCVSYTITNIIQCPVSAMPLMNEPFSSLFLFHSVVVWFIFYFFFIFRLGPFHLLPRWISYGMVVACFRLPVDVGCTERWYRHYRPYSAI